MVQETIRGKFLLAVSTVGGNNGDMKLKAYIEWKGEPYCAELFGVKIRTIASWRRGERRPRPDQANEIVRLTRGTVQLEDIYVPVIAQTLPENISEVA